MTFSSLLFFEHKKIWYYLELILYLLVWFSCNICVGFLSRELLYAHKFTYPVYIALCQSLARIGVSHVCYGWKCIYTKEVPIWIGWKNVGRLMIPTALFYACDMMLSYTTVMNEDYRVYQLVRMTDTVFVLLGMYLLGVEKMNWQIKTCMVAILFGTFTATFISGAVGIYPLLTMLATCFLGAGSTVMTGAVLQVFEPLVLHFYVSIISTIVLAVCFFVDDFTLGMKEDLFSSFAYFRLSRLLFLLIIAWTLKVGVGTLFQLRSSSLSFSMSITILNVFSYVIFIINDYSGVNLWTIIGVCIEIVGLVVYTRIRY